MSVRFDDADDGIAFSEKNIRQFYVLCTNTPVDTAESSEFLMHINPNDYNNLFEYNTALSAGTTFIRQTSQLYWAGYADLDNAIWTMMATSAANLNDRKYIHTAANAYQLFDITLNAFYFKSVSKSIPIGTRIEVWGR